MPGISKLFPTALLLVIILVITFVFAEVTYAICQNWVSPPWAYNHGSHQILYISYKWGPNLQTPGTAWRNAFSASASDWTNTPTPIDFYYSSTSSNSFDLYYRCDNTAGETPQSTNSSGYLVSFISRANTCYSHTTGHELGHGAGLGHLCSSEGMALMGWNPNPEGLYTPQSPDNRYANDVYW